MVLSRKTIHECLGLLGRSYRGKTDMSVPPGLQLRGKTDVGRTMAPGPQLRGKTDVGRTVPAFMG